MELASWALLLSILSLSATLSMGVWLACKHRRIPRHTAGTAAAHQPLPEGAGHQTAAQFLGLCQMSKDLIFDRRKLEWKLTLSLWAAIAVVTYGLMKHYQGCWKDEGLGSVGYWCIVSAFGVAALLHCLVFLPTNTGSTAKDMRLIAYYRRRIHEALGDKTPYDADFPDIKEHPLVLGWKCSRLFLPQAALSIALVVVASVILWGIR